MLLGGGKGDAVVSSARSATHRSRAGGGASRGALPALQQGAPTQKAAAA